MTGEQQGWLGARTPAGSADDATGLREDLARAACLRHLLDVYQADEDDKPHEVPIWEAWLRQSGELPPDLNALPANAFLPDVLAFADGRPVSTPEAWRRRREEIVAILRYWQLGSWPDVPPAMRADDLGAAVDEALDGTLRRVCLVFGPSARAVASEPAAELQDLCHYRVVRLHIEVFVPRGAGSFPALVTVGDRGGRMRSELAAWAASRRYVCCAFDPGDAFAAHDVYAGCDGNELVWWAYAASRCVDHLCALPEVDRARIAVFGHSRGGKMAVIAAALEERFGACIASHTGSGSGTVPPWRYLGEKHGAETLESSTRSYPYWNHPRLRFFAGRENKLPFDSHFLLALIAPRPLLISEGTADVVGEPWGAQQAYLATRRVYEFLGCADDLNIVFHPGGHRLAPKALAQYGDWLDMRFGRRPLAWADELLYTYSFDAWRRVTGEELDPTTFPERGLDDLLLAPGGSPIGSLPAWETKREEIKARVVSILGELPPRPSGAADLTNMREAAPGLLRADLPLEGKLVGHLTYPAAPGRLATVIYLHAYLDARGWDWPPQYGWSPSVGERLARQGLLAVEYDQFGYGTRNRDCGIDFYAAHPRQSALGVMVQDVSRIIDALRELDIVDPERIMVAGFSLGGAVALHVAALDERIRAVASTCGFGSMRLDAHGNQTEGLRRYSHLRPTLPRLGFFLGHERRVPYDYHELLALIAPRPALIVAPRLDQDWLFADVEACCRAAAEVYRLLGAPDAIRLEAPDDFNRYAPTYQNLVNTWLCNAARRP